MTEANRPTEQCVSPGPWKARLSKTEFSYGIWDGKGRYLAGGSWNETGVSFPPRLESGANLRLMAAAPELLAALKEMGDWIAAGLQASDEAWPDARCLKHTEEIAARARAAVDKAEGRS